MLFIRLSSFHFPAPHFHVGIPLPAEKRLIIKNATDSDLNDVLRIQTEAFGHNKESNLVNDLLNDGSAKPLLSLLAIDDEEAVGHILFTKVRITENDDAISAIIRDRLRRTQFMYKIV